MKTLFIVNPVAGRRKSPKRLILRIRKIYREVNDREFEIKIWKKAEDIDDLISYARVNRFKTVIAVGGDGTVHAIGTRLIGTDMALGIVPSGSGNGYASHLGIPKKLDDSIRSTLYANVVKVDTGVFGGYRFLNCAGFGIDAMVTLEFAKSKTRGLQTYVQLGTKAYFKYKTTEAIVHVDDEEPKHLKNLMTLAIMNGTEWGRGAKVAPYSSIRDGYFSMVFVEKASVVSVARLLRLLFLGKLHKHPKVHIFEGKKFKMVRPGPAPAQVDGDPIGELGRTIECEIDEKSLNILVPEQRSLEV